MARNWTKAQLDALTERDRTLLVCAAAGSGKTAVLTERVIRMLTDTEHPADISRMLVVTFTRAAAGELRQRIAEALSKAILETDDSKKKAHLSNQLVLLGGAAISTIDSFYFDLVRTNFQKASFSASVRLADETELLGLRRELMNDVVDAMYAECADFHLISDILCDLRSEQKLTDALLDIYERLLRYPEALDILSRSAADMEKGASAPLDTPWGEVWAKEVRELAQTGETLFLRLLELTQMQETAPKLLDRYGKVVTERLERVRAIQAHLDAKRYEEARLALAADFDQKNRGGGYPARTPDLIETMTLYSHFMEKWKQKHVPALSAFSADEIKQSAAESAHALRLLHQALTRFEGLYSAAKAQREIAEFSDISRAAYHLLIDKNGAPTPLAAEVREKYDAIFIDEYQDVDSMQDATFRAIATDKNRFMVGDIKQSIYRFRGAQPKVFADYREAFPPLKDAAKGAPATIFMSNCFRCDKHVIDFSNAVSGDLFSACAESIGYTIDDDLVHSKEKEHESYVSEKCRVVLINRAKTKKEGQEESEEEKNSGKLEARWIAQEIGRLLKDPPLNAKGEPITPADIAVLMRSATLAEHIAGHLAELGIPCNDTSRKSFFENPDVLCVYSLLAALDNPYRDVYLAATLRSPFFGFTLEDLVKIHAKNGGKLALYDAVKLAAQEDAENALATRLRDFQERFGKWREKAKSLPVDRLLRELYRENAILSFAGRTDDAGNSPAERRANLQRLYEYARTFESNGFKGLYQFVRYVDGIMETQGKMPAPEGEKNAVSLITIHHSKGLEYPVCFLAGTATRFNDKDLSDHFQDDEELGCAIRLPNAGPFSRTNTFFRESIALRLRRLALEEEMRVLYVAMTRAKERLYVTADSPFGVKHLEKYADLASIPGGEFVCARGPAYIYWILAALKRKGYENFANIEVIEEKDILLPPEQKNSSPQKEAEEKVEIPAFLKERFDFVYPAEHLTHLPAKLSVSQLSPGILDKYDTDAAKPSDIQKADEAAILAGFTLAPTFLSPAQKQSAAARGTATHEFLQFCDFEKAEKDAKAELERLIERRFLPPDTRELVRFEELERFFESRFYQSLKHARTLRRETRFHIFLPAAGFTEKKALADALGEEKLAVQGVIDLFYEDAEGKLILCDYKTDRLTAAELASPYLAAAKLKERHGEQLSYYARALEEICGKRPDKILIYSLPLGEALEIEI